jgi:hypothetical protein
VNYYLLGTGMQIWHVLKSHDFWATKLPNPNSFHTVLLNVYVMFIANEKWLINESSTWSIPGSAVCSKFRTRLVGVLVFASPKLKLRAADFSLIC